MIQSNSEADCLTIAYNILNHTFFCLKTIQVEEFVVLIEKMCKTPVALHNSTHIGPNQNAAIINSWWLFSSYTGENGNQHHALHLNMYTWAVLWMVMVAIGLVIAMVWLCKGPIFQCYSKVLFKVITHTGGTTG